MSGTITVQNIQGPTTGSNANQVLIPSGHKLHAPGHVIQVVDATTQTQTATNGTSFVDTGLTVSITPKFASSKMFITVSQALSFTNTSDDQYQGNLIIADGSNNTIFGGSSYDQFRIKNMIAFHWQANLQSTHSPNTTSSFTYKTRMKSIYNGTYIYTQYGNVAPSSITVMEIAQ